MYKNILLAMLLVMAWALCPSIASASTYYLFDDWGGTYSDAEKSPTNNDDDLMCWAASASNVLAWTGWGSVVGDADTIFAYYQQHWSDEGGNAYYAWLWWFYGVNLKQGASGWSQEDVDGGGGFYTGENFYAYWLFSSDDAAALSSISTYLHDGYGVSLTLKYGDNGHVVTCWGYEYDEQGNIIGVYVTDSDDDKNVTDPDDVLAYYLVLFNDETDAWYLQDLYGSDSWYIAEVQGLKIDPVSAVPVPATVLLLGSGLLVCTRFRKRFKRA